MIPPSTRLRRALQLRSTSLVKRIISSNPQNPGLVRNVDLDDKANTSLHIAALLGLPDIAEYLLDAGHEDRGISRNTDGITPLMFAAQAGDNQTDEVCIGRAKVARMLVERFPDSTAIRDKSGMDVFQHGARYGTNPLLELLLRLPPPMDLTPYADESEGEALPPVLHPFLNVKDELGNTPLHHASAAGQLKTLRLLINAGADAGAPNKNYWTPSDYSATVAAEVYLRNLLKEREHTKAFEQGIARGAVNTTRIRGPSDVTRGAVRLVKSDSSIASESSDEESEVWRARTRAGT